MNNTLPFIGGENIEGDSSLDAAGIFVDCFSGVLPTNESKSSSELAVICTEI